MKRWIAPAIFVSLLVLWWLVLADWFAKPQTYRLPVLYLAVVLVSGALHTRALWNFWGMVKQIQIAEHMGHVDPGSTAYASNQRFRYMVRMVETLVVLTVAVVTLLSVSDPALELSHSFTRLILTYFVGSIAATGYLTFRDIRVFHVINSQQEKRERQEADD